MTGTTRDAAALLRGAAAGGLTVALSIAAHTAAGGGTAAGAVAAELAVVAATVGCLAATLRHADRTPLLVALLGAGQLLSHLVQSSAGHAHAGTSPVMVGTHLAAVAVGAALIASGGRLCAALSRAVRVGARATGPQPVGPAVMRPVRAAHGRPRATVMLAGPVARRGPPVGAAC